MESAGVLSLCNNYGENSIGFYKLYIKVQRFCKSAEVLHFTLINILNKLALVDFATRIWIPKKAFTGFLKNHGIYFFG